jgi:hypothetical protein
LASEMPKTFLAKSITAHWKPKQIPEISNYKRSYHFFT